MVDRGFLYLQEEKFEEALEISKQLEKLRFTAAFDIGAQAYRALGNMRTGSGQAKCLILKKLCADFGLKKGL